MTDQPVTGSWVAAAWRCSCGFFAADEPSLDAHLEATADAVPEHFEVLDGWTLEEVAEWIAARGGPAVSGPVA